MHAPRQLPISDRFMHLMESAARATEQGTPELADQLYDQAAQECPEVFIGLAGSFKKDGCFDDAFKWSMMALKHAKKPATKAYCWNNAGMLLEGIGEQEKAEACFLEGLKIDKRQQDLLCNYALALKWRNQIPEALRVINRAIQNNPVNYQAIWCKALMELARGNLIEGFALAESRFNNPAGKASKLVSNKPEWNGKFHPGMRLLVYCEQGAGDTIMVARYASWLHSNGAQVILGCQKGLKELLAGMDSITQVVEDGEKLPEFDCHIPTMSLPRLHRTTLETIPQPPYLAAAAPMDLPGTFKVGISWAGSIDHIHDRFRSTDLSQWSEILAVPGVTFYSLQVGIRSMDLVGSEAPIVDLSPRIKTYADTANAIAGLDLVISVDTSTVHLAGAMGKPCWVLLPFAPDWRWLLERTDSPWYPSLLLCRQRAPREWEPLLGSAAQMLRSKYEALATK